MKPSLIICFFIGIIFFSYVKGLYEKNEDLQIDNMILESELLEKEVQMDSLTKMVYKLEKKLETPKEIKPIKKPKKVIEKPVLPEIEDTLVNVIDTLNN